MMNIWRKKTLLRTMTNQNNLKMKNLIVIDFYLLFHYVYYLKIKVKY